LKSSFYLSKSFNRNLSNVVIFASLLPERDLKRLFRNKYRQAFLLAIVLFLGLIILQFKRVPGNSPEKAILAPVAVDSTLIKLEQDLKSYGLLFEQGISRCRCPGAALVIVKDTSIVFLKGYGTKKIRNNDSVDEHTVFRLGSLSKGFAAVTAGMLVEQGYFYWNDKVKNFYPEFKLKSQEQTERIEIRHILSHTTGLIRHAYTNLIEEGWSIDKIATILDEVDLVSKEGQTFAYQNATYSLIEKVIQKSTGKEYQEILEHDIFNQCGMTDASCTFEDFKRAGDKSVPHALVSRNYIYHPTHITRKYYNSVSSGGVNASASDMGQWLKVLLGNRPDIITNKTLDRIFQPVIKTHERRFYDSWKETSGSWYAMGWRVLDFHNRQIVYHGGYVNGYRSEIALDRENGIGICVLFNASCDYAKWAIRDFFNFYDTQIEAPQKMLIAHEESPTLPPPNGT
jgi:beta-lactamase class C